ncbi:uncharacterized protein LOC110420382 isoform X2 [Herrania umbratica]|uniref:Uncharacterized protein LOC110420382 isoform X2 n=1 Tax=Herrania umbratica TaxID=108875 RepID=A0A6J1AR33_9ROSI|nr:uncharacterized protein LOC110420382 isoform X2 [Herrania umbratica]
MDLERGLASSSSASTPGEAAEGAEEVTADRMEMEAAEILAALAHSKKRDAVAVAVEFSAKWGCKGKRVSRRVSSSESPPSEIGLNPVDPVQSSSDLAEDRAAVDQQQSQVTSTPVIIDSIEAEQDSELLNGTHPCAARYTSKCVVKSRQNAEKETLRLHRMFTNKESDWQMIRERQILFSIMGMPEKDVWEDGQHDQMTGNDLLIKSVKAERNAESVKSSPTCATKYTSGGGGRSRQNLTEAEKEARRLRRILANRESARQTIRRRQALCEKLTLKVADLTRENENLKRLIHFDCIPTEKAKELALKEYKSQESTNKHLKAQMVKAIKAEEGQAPRELKLAHQTSGPSRNYPFYFYNQHPFSPFCWPSIVQSSNPVQTQCGHQIPIVVPSSVSAPTNGRLDSSHDQENPINNNGPKSPLYVVPYPWFFSLPDHGNELHPQPSFGPKNNKDETSANNRLCSLKSVVHEEKYNFSLPTEVEKEAYGSIEASSNNQNCTSVRLPSDGSGQCIRYQIKEEVILPTPLCSAGATFVVEQDKMPDVNTEAARVRACHFVGALQEENQESTNYTSKKVLDAAAAAEARKRRKELTKLKNLHGRQCRTHR